MVKILTRDFWKDFGYGPLIETNDERILK